MNPVLDSLLQIGAVRCGASIYLSAFPFICMNKDNKNSCFLQFYLGLAQGGGGSDEGPMWPD